jgi:hypothetical protein
VGGDQVKHKCLAWELRSLATETSNKPTKTAKRASKTEQETSTTAALDLSQKAKLDARVKHGGMTRKQARAFLADRGI